MKLLLVGVAIGVILAVVGVNYLLMGEALVSSSNGATLGGGELPATQKAFRLEAVGYTLIGAAITIPIALGILDNQLQARRRGARIRGKL